MTSSVDKRVREFDLRISVSLVTDHQEHSRPVMALTCSENYVYSGGEDKTLCVWDRRSQSVLQTLRVCAHSYILTCCNAGPTFCVTSNTLKIMFRWMVAYWVWGNIMYV